MSSKKAGPISSFFTGLIFTIMGGGFTFLNTWPDFQAAKSSVNWPKTDGIILDSKVISRKDSDKKTMYSANIEYSYELNGEKFKSSQIYKGSEGNYSSDSSDAYQYKSRYPVGRKVQVSYSPNEIGEALLEPGLKMSHYLSLGVTMIFCVLGFFLILTSLFKITVFATLIGIGLAFFFKKNKVKNSAPPSGPTNLKTTNAVLDEEINLDDEMKATNKVVAKSVSPENEPWKFKWMIKTSKKDYGPYQFEDLVRLVEKGKVADRHECFAQGTSSVIKISKIISKKAS